MYSGVKVYQVSHHESPALTALLNRKGVSYRVQQRLPPSLLLNKDLQKRLLLEKTISLDPAYEKKKALC